MEEEESKQIKRTLNDLTVKIDELSKQLGKQLEKKKNMLREDKRKSSCLCGRSIRRGIIVGS